MPHHPAVTPFKSTTNVMLVYDASAKVSKGVKYLNDCLCGILLGLRIYCIVILADVEKAFLQISIWKQDRDVTRFPWFQDPNQPEQVEGNLNIY